MGLVEIRGQPLTSVFSIADHCFISSEIGGIFGRSRMLRAFCLAGRFRFAFFAFITSLGQSRSSPGRDRKSTRLNSSHTVISYAVFCLKKKKTKDESINYYISKSRHR